MTDKIVERMARALCCPKGCAGDGERDCSYLAMTDTAQAAYDASGAKELLEACEAAVSSACVSRLTAGQEYFRDNDASRAAIVLLRAAIAKAQA